MALIELKEDEVVIKKTTADTFRAMGREMIELKAEVKQIKDQAEALQKLILSYKIAYELLAYCVFKLTGAFGLNNAEGTIREEILAGDESPMSSLLKEMGVLMKDAMMAEGGSKEKRAQMEKRFEFFKFLPGVAQFYKAQRQYPIAVPDEYTTGFPDEVVANLKTKA